MNVPQMGSPGEPHPDAELSKYDEKSMPFFPLSPHVIR